MGTSLFRDGGHKKMSSSHAPSIRSQIFSQWDSQKNRFAFISPFLPPCIWDLPSCCTPSDPCGSRFPANESLRRTGLHLTLSAKSSFHLPAFEISRSCCNASERFYRLLPKEIGALSFSFPKMLSSTIWVMVYGSKGIFFPFKFKKLILLSHQIFFLPVSCGKFSASTRESRHVK